MWLVTALLQNSFYLEQTIQKLEKVIRVNTVHVVDKNMVAVGNDVYSADHILIAVGGYPAWPSIPGQFLLVKFGWL